MGGKPFQSKLLPYSNEIRKYRTQGISYQQITEILKHNFGINVDPSTVFSFVKRRSKKRKKVISMLDAEYQTEVRKPFPGIVTREKQISIFKEKPRGKFHYNPDEPIT